MRRILLAVLMTGLVVVVARPAHAATPAAGPYRNPPWHCRFQHFGDGQAPQLGAHEPDPFCVDYAKRDITVDDGGAVRFAEAEPARFAAAIPACRYWQTDHWSVQVDRAYGAVLSWDGSYWYDRGAGYGAAILRHFQLAGQPVGAWQAAAAAATVSPQLAAAIRAYGARPTGGGGASFTFPAGPGCQPA